MKKWILAVLVFLFVGCQPAMGAPDIEAEAAAIIKAATRNNCTGSDRVILFAIRMAENGPAGFEFGIMHPQAAGTNLDTQAGWAAATIVKNRQRWIGAGRPGDFITFLARRYCPAQTDPEGHINWKRNVRFYFTKFSKKGAI